MKRLVIKPGAAEFLRVGSKMDGFDVTRHILDTLVSKGLATTTDCCTYTLAGGGGGATNLTMTRNATTVTVASDTGTDAVIPAADGTNAGLLVPAQFNKLGFITITQAVDLDAAEADIADLTTLSGVASNATNLGTFTGTTIPDSQTVKQALQALETAVENAPTMTTANITFTGANVSSGCVATYIGTVAPTLTKVSASEWTLALGATRLVSADIYTVTADNPGSTLTLNITTTSSVANQGQSTMVIPHILGVNLAGGFPASYNPDTGGSVLSLSVNAAPTNGDITILVGNWAAALGAAASVLKIMF